MYVNYISINLENYLKKQMDKYKTMKYNTDTENEMQRFDTPINTPKFILPTCSVSWPSDWNIYTN